MASKAVIFDLDGTLVDNMMVHHRAWQLFLEELGLFYTIDQVKESIHGINIEILERLFPDRYTPAEKKQLSDKKEATYRQTFQSQLSLLPGVLEFIHSLEENKIPFGIGTAAPVENVDFVLDGLNIRAHFNAIVHAGMVDKGKPNPEVFEKVAQELGVPLSECLVFEDSPTGAKAAANGGAKTVIVTTTHPKSDFDNIPNIIHYQNDFSDMTFLSCSNKLITYA